MALNHMSRTVGDLVMQSVMRGSRLCAAWRLRIGGAMLALIWLAAPAANAQTPGDAAAQFGAVEAVSSISLSPDGSQIAYVSPAPSIGNILFVVGVAEGSVPRRVLRATGEPEWLYGCLWATNVRLICDLGGREVVNGDVYGFRSMVAVDAVGGNVRLLSNRRGPNEIGFDFRGARLIDRLPGDDNHVLITRAYAPEVRFGALVSNSDDGMGVDRVDINDGTSRRVEPPRRDTVSYASDGHGNVRLMAVRPIVGQTGLVDETVRHYYRPQNGGEWQALTTYNVVSDVGFQPVLVDAATNRAVGYAQVDGRQAVLRWPLMEPGRWTLYFPTLKSTLMKSCTPGHIMLWSARPSLPSAVKP